MSERLLSGRLPRPRIALLRRPLSNRASTASCSMRFSLRRMTSGARCEMSFCRRLLRLMTRRYRSFRSDVAKRPPSNGTSGRKSGGMTGRTSSTIQSGRACDEAKPCTSFRGFAIFGLVEKLSLRERRLTRIYDDIVFVVNHALELSRAHVEHEAETGG